MRTKEQIKEEGIFIDEILDLIEKSDNITQSDLQSILAGIYSRYFNNKIKSQKNNNKKEPKKYKIRCNNCMKHFEDDSELELLKDNKSDPESYKGCPNCKTDGYLADIL